jgi:hypothetical protein
MNNFNCPICKTKMEGMDGEKMHPGDKKYGFTWYCVNRNCSSEEVFGHGENEKKAYEIVMAKYGGVKRVE